MAYLVFVFFLLGYALEDRGQLAIQDSECWQTPSGVWPSASVSSTSMVSSVSYTTGRKHMIRVTWQNTQINTRRGEGERWFTSSATGVQDSKLC